MTPTLYGERVILRGPRDSDVDDRLRHPIDPEEEDGYGSSWRREWDGRRYHTREYLTATSSPSDPRTYTWKVEYDGHCIGSAGLEVNPQQHYAEYTVGLFVAALRGRGLGREVTRLVLAGRLMCWVCTASSCRRWPATAVPSTATWPAASAGKGSTPGTLGVSACSGCCDLRVPCLSWCLFPGCAGGVRAWRMPACRGGSGARFHGPRSPVGGRFLLPDGLLSWHPASRSRVRIR